MPRFYFETDDKDFHYRDGDGTDLAGPHAARKEALLALPDMVKDLLPSRDEFVLKSVVRDASNAIVFEGTLTLEGKWHKRPRYQSDEVENSEL